MVQLHIYPEGAGALLALSATTYIIYPYVVEALPTLGAAAYTPQRCRSSSNIKCKKLQTLGVVARCSASVFLQ